jgi:hypothetical protein
VSSEKAFAAMRHPSKNAGYSNATVSKKNAALLQATQKEQCSNTAKLHSFRCVA